MLVSGLLGKRYKEQPSDAYMKSHIFMLRGGYVRQVAAGIFTLLTPAKRAASKIEAIIREEMDSLGMQEVLFPVVLPAELWHESGRLESVGGELMRMKDRAGRNLLLGMTHEEAAVHLARSEVTSYGEYPFAVYQIQTKFRDEPRARAGLIRVREFTMKDAYSFHTSEEDLDSFYSRVHEAYIRVYTRLGLDGVISVSSDTGMMGGGAAHEFMYLSDGGEDSIAICPCCGNRANVEIAACKHSRRQEEQSAPGEVYTPGIKDIESLSGCLGIDKSRTIKAAVFAVSGRERPVVVFIRGDRQVNEAKLRLITGGEVYPYQGGYPGLEMGFIGPVGLDSAADVVFDESVRGMNNAVCGANKRDYHLTGISLERDFPQASFIDVCKAADGDLCPECGGEIAVKSGIEVGNIFKLGKKYSESMGMTYTGEDGARHYPLMGCYGIGVGRLMACVMEEHSDDNGPIWPITAAPWQIHICMPGNRGKDTLEAARGLYDSLSVKYDVLLDNRDAAAGVQFADADLLGAPIRVIVSERNMKTGEVEVMTRDKSIVRRVLLSNAEAEIDNLACELYSRLNVKDE